MPFTILWDNDGVLVDTERLFFQATADTLATVGVTFDREQFIEISLNRGASAFDLVKNKSKREVDALRDQRNQHYSALLGAADCTLPGVQETLNALHGAVNMGVVTSSRRDHFDIMHAHTGLLPYFNFIYTLEDYPRTKPHPDPYLAALNGENLNPDECVVIEDSERGLTSATRAGLRCIMLPNAFTQQCAFDKAYKVLSDIRDVPRLVFMLSGLKHGD